MPRLANAPGGGAVHTYATKSCPKWMGSPSGVRCSMWCRYRAVLALSVMTRVTREATRPSIMWICALPVSVLFSSACAFLKASAGMGLEVGTGAGVPSTCIPTTPPVLPVTWMALLESSRPAASMARPRTCRLRYASPSTATMPCFATAQFTSNVSPRRFAHRSNTSSSSCAARFQPDFCFSRRRRALVETDRVATHNPGTTRAVSCV
mmetsp:Transcript_36621/g.91815  ORF Transcript_36621/g.91815 Transcript_36621/m.91815 type:complete len:208 (-) Transcript_36621:76-699(-)